MTHAEKQPGHLSVKQSVAVGVTLFSMFFGAGNLILPSLMALQAGTNVIPAVAGFLAAGIGLPIMGIVAVALVGTARELAGRVHSTFALVFVTAIYLSIGPCLAIPRTSSTAFEMLIPLLPAEVPVSVAQAVFSVVFFALAFFFALKPTSLTRLLGRVTGPALIVLIVAVVGSAIANPAGTPQAPQAPFGNAPAIQGFLSGYQTMDLLASLTFGLVIAENIRGLGIADDRGLTREISRAGVVAGMLMGLIYCGLAFVGATYGTVMPNATNGAAILTASATMHFGIAGTIVVATIYLLACLNVCIGLISCCGTYFAETFGASSPEPGRHVLGRVPYAAWAAVFASFSCALSNFGLDAILAFSVPLLGALYPISIVLVIMGMTHRACDAVPSVWPWVTGVVAVLSVASALRDALAPGMALPSDLLPLSDIGLGWILPAIVAALVGIACSHLKSRSA